MTALNEELVLVDPADLKQDIKKRNAEILVYILTRTQSCPACVQQEKDLEPFLTKPIFSSIVKIDLDASEGNLELARVLDLEYTPSFLFVKKGNILNVEDPYAHSRSLLNGAQKPEVLEKIFEIIQKNDRGFEAILQKTCESCNFKPVCILNHALHYKKCRLYWRNKKFNVFLIKT